MIYTTLNRIRDNQPCSDGWTKLLKHLGKTQADDEPLALLTVLESNGLDDTLWCLRAIDEWREVAMPFARWCADRAKIHSTSYIYQTADATRAAGYADSLAAGYAAVAARYAASLAAHYAAHYAASLAFHAERQAQIAKLTELIS